MDEQWRDVVGHPKYQVSNLGRVKVKSYCIIYKKDNRRGRQYPEKILPIRKSRNGYCYISIIKENRNETYQLSIHRAVAIAFIPNLKNSPDVNHIDFDKENNNVNNLEWCTKSENMQHSSKAGRLKNKNSKIVSQYNLKGELIRTFISQLEAERITGIKQSTISNCCIFKRRSKDFLYSFGNAKIIKPYYRKYRKGIKIDMFKENHYIKSFEKITDAALEIKTSIQNIYSNLTGKSKKCKGYTFKLQDI